MSNSEDLRVRILVASHKPYWMPPDPMYLPVQVGAACGGGRAGIPGFQRDDEGDNMSAKNPNYCELTALYWAWRNLDADYVGLAHYRRHFKGSGERGTLTSEEARDLLREAPIVLPKKRNYVIETIRSHYGNTFDPRHVDVLRDSVELVSPECLGAFDACMGSTSAHMFNMLVMEKNLLGEYCSWLFPVLSCAQKGIDFESMTPFEARCVGRLSEMLLDVWVEANRIPYVEHPVVSMERVNWARKGSAFLAAKFLGRKYRGSF